MSEFIVMLTNHDETVSNARELFNQCKAIPVKHWGFKDIGLAPNEVISIVDDMKKAGKTTYLEVVSLTEEEGLCGANLAVKAGFDVLMGTVFYDSINNLLKDKPIKYFPFPGKIVGHPSVLTGSVEEIVEHSKFLENKGVDGLDLLTYRYTGDPALLLRKVIQSVGIPVVSAGSIESRDRIIEVSNSGAWGFTIGSALFNNCFAIDGSFKENINEVLEILVNNSN